MNDRINSDTELFPEMVAGPPPTLELEDDYKSDEELLQIKPREIIKHDDIFKTDKPKNIKVKKEVVDDSDEPDEQVEPVEQVKPVKKKRVMSDEHKAKLAIAREKANATRKANAVNRKKDNDIIKEEKDLAKKLRERRVLKMRNMVEDPIERPVVQQVVEPVAKQVVEPVAKPVVQSGFTQDQMDRAIMKALEVNETKRKERKVKKKELQVEEQRKAQVFNTVSKALDPSVEMWAHCFK
jgi:hypothetical protein